MISVKDFTDFELDEQIKNAALDMEEAVTNADYNAAHAELIVAKKEKKRREINE